MESQDQTPRQHPEVPVITIERSVERPAGDAGESGAVRTEVTIIAPPPVSRRRKLLMRLLKMAAIFVTVFAAMLVYRQYVYFHPAGVSISASPEENIELLEGSSAAVAAVVPGVTLTGDSLLGVAFDLYALHGLRATIEFQRPDSTDTGVYLWSRCADYTSDGQYIGTLVADGQRLQSDRTRLGYMAMLHGRAVIGVARTDIVADYVADHGGSFFRQFILLSDGELPPVFHLKGKVERRAVGHIGQQLYYIATRHRETLYDFADALRQYGFTDAIYITGGNTDNVGCFWRDSLGTARLLNPAEKPAPTSPPPATEGTGIKVPYLVFRHL